MTAPRIADIQREVARRYDVGVIDITSRRRCALPTRARMVAMYLSKTLTRHSLGTIGRAFGDRDHTTVLHAVQRINSLIDRDAALARDIGEMRKTFGAADWKASIVLPEVEAFDMALNSFGFELAIVPIGTRDASGFSHPDRKEA